MSISAILTVVVDKKGDFPAVEICDCLRVYDDCLDASSRASFLTIARHFVEEIPFTMYSTLEFDDHTFFLLIPPDEKMGLCFESSHMLAYCLFKPSMDHDQIFLQNAAQLSVYGL